MDKIKEFFAHPIIQVALAAGVSVVTLAYFSKHVLPVPLSNLELAFPPFVATLFEGIAKLRKGAWYTHSIFGVVAILLATLLVIVFNT